MLDRCAWLFIAVTLAGCASHRVRIRPVPAADAPYEERVDAFRDLQLEFGQSTDWYEGKRKVGATFDFVIMGDSTRLSDPRDLLPAVNADCMTAKHVANFERHNRVASRVETISVVSGLATMAALVLTGAVAWSDPQGPRFLGPGLIVGGGAASVFGLILIPAYSSGEVALARDDRVSAFMSFNKCLAERLELRRAPQLTPPPMPPPEPAPKRLPNEASRWNDVPWLVTSR
ncbi:MAG: hypothetical protein U0228_14060 [Myxococcaceae bacterium]